MIAARSAALLCAVVAAVPLAAQSSAPARHATGQALHAQVAAMDRAMKPGQGFAYQPLVEADGQTAALEIWKAPGRPAVHPDDAEYVMVVDGAGEMISGGSLVDAKTTRADLIEGSRIAGGTTQPLKTGDVFLVPAGVPHWFGIRGPRLVLLGTKIRTHR
ncbi:MULTISPECIES: cupin domain-containing protein [unclassified Sphingomonas]|uniref:cupin domain-containing protein n=1 Tax=unclassified Sphingomonas TaxID=196159 RepID=UPI00044964C2|nr:MULTISPECIES: cupin domain-containing protein [unclassified Sphingomonas]EZP50443.1 Cupin domain protein [Sphingomonas sp. RIT328]